jgi:AcrR family transcriptional regulator
LGSQRHRLTAAERRKRILSAAAQTFASKGYRAASISEICEKAGITKPVFYDHFDSKYDAFIEVIKDARDKLISTGSEIMQHSAPAQQRVREAIASFFIFVQEQPTLARVLLFGARGDPELAAVDWKVQQEATERIASLLRDGVKSPHLSSQSHNQTLHLRAEFLKIGIHGLAEWWLHNPETPREILIDTIMDLVWPSLKILHFQDNA